MASFSSILSPPSAFSVQFQSLHLRHRPILLAARTNSSSSSLPIGCTIGMVSNIRRKYSPIVTFAASPDDSESESESSEPPEAEIDVENNELKQAGKETQEAWEKTLADFKEQALKLQNVSQEAYEVYTRKAAVILKETAEQLKIPAEQASKYLTVMAKELSEEGRQYLTTAAVNSPEPVKDVMETFASTDDLDDVSKVRDFYVGVPYGAILSVGGFLNFMLTGSISALRFGVILGGILLALSVSSLRAWKKGKASDMTLKGQAAIAGILFLRDLGLVFQGSTPFRLVKTIISGAITSFFIYRITCDKPHQRPNLNGEVQS